MPLPFLLLFSASIRSKEDVMVAIRARADSLAIGSQLLKEMLKCKYIDLTELDLGNAFNI